MLQLVLSWPVRVIVIGLLLFSIFVDGAGYIYRFQNHCPISGACADLPPHFGDWQIYIHKGLDIQGGTHLVLQLSNFPPGRDHATVVQQTIDVLNKRVNALGTSEPQIQAAGGDRVFVDLAGVSASQAQTVIGQRAQLITTKWVKDPAQTVSQVGPMPGYRPEITNLTSDMLTNANASLDSTGTQWVVNITFNSQGADIFGKLTTDAYNACSTSDCPERHIAEWLDLSQDDINHWADPGYADKVSASTANGGKLLTDPTISEPITGGQAQISGSFTQASAKDLATLLNSGALPVKIDILQSTEVGASLGADSIKRSLAAGLLGLVIVVVFMIAFYRVPGLLASLALLFYSGVVLAVYKSGIIPLNLSLAGMAGFILSVGMAVDANVLIFERFKEEMRAGRTIGAAVDAAVKRAWPAIRDSNTSTLITTLLLMYFGQGPVKGFAVTLFIGVLTSLVSSIVVTHNLLAIVLNFNLVRTPAALGVERGRA